MPFSYKKTADVKTVDKRLTILHFVCNGMVIDWYRAIINPKFKRHG